MEEVNKVEQAAKAPLFDRIDDIYQRYEGAYNRLAPLDRPGGGPILFMTASLEVMAEVVKEMGEAKIGGQRTADILSSAIKNISERTKLSGFDYGKPDQNIDYATPPSPNPTTPTQQG